MHLWELACKFHVLINAKIQTCIKLIKLSRKEIVFGLGLGKRQKNQFFELSRLPQRVPNFSKL